MVLAASGWWLWTILFIVVWIALVFWYWSPTWVSDKSTAGAAAY